MGEAWNSTGVLAKLTDSGAMCVFLRDSARVLSMPSGSGATPEMKNYTLKIFNSRAKLPFPDSKHCDKAELLIVIDWVGKMWTMYVHGVSGEAEVTRTTIQYSPKDQGPMIAMNWNKEARVLPVCHQVL